MLVSEEALPKDSFSELDCLICGYYAYTPAIRYSNQSPRDYLPVLRVSKILGLSDNKLDLLHPVQKSDEPELSVTEQGVTLTIDKVEYRGRFYCVYYSIDNQSEDKVKLSPLTVRHGVETLSGKIEDYSYKLPSQLEPYLDLSDEKLISIALPHGNKRSGIQFFMPSHSDDPLDITIKATALSKNDLPISGRDDIELKLSYRFTDSAQTTDSEDETE